jgi:hypothetical protein
MTPPRKLQVRPVPEAHIQRDIEGGAVRPRSRAVTQQDAHRKNHTDERQPRPPLTPQRGLTTDDEAEDFEEGTPSTGAALSEVAVHGIALVRFEQLRRQVGQGPADARHDFAHATPRLTRRTAL